MAEPNPIPPQAAQPQSYSKSPSGSPPAVGETNLQQIQASIVAHQAETIIEVGNDEDGYETEAESRVSTSISSSVRNYAFEHGRRYHKFREGRYQFPNDESEQEREDMKHAMIANLCGGKLHFAPLENPQSIIDVGTGTGIWAIDIGDEYNSAQVLGIDLSPIQPAWVPPNVKFMVDDAESKWLHPLDTFDFVHIRHMNSSVKNWPKLLTEAYNHTKPGGWIELQELQFILKCDDDTMKEGYVVEKFLQLVKEGLAVFGVDLLSVTRNAQLLRDAGFVNIEEKVLKVPLGTWPKNKTMKMIGLYLRSVIYDGLQGIALGPFTRGMKWTPNEVEVFLVDVRKSLMDYRTHSYLPFHVVYGQKPPKSE